MRTLTAVLTLAVLACATTREPDTFAGQVDTELTVGEAVPVVVKTLESMDFRIESMERSQGLVIGERSAVQGERVTVTLREEGDRISFQVVGQSDAGPSDAENAARQVRNQIEQELGGRQASRR